MKPRVDCGECKNFIPPKQLDEDNLLSPITENAKCKLGKRVMFRKPKSQFDSDYGWIRYCNEFK